MSRTRWPIWDSATEMSSPSHAQRGEREEREDAATAVSAWHIVTVQGSDRGRENMEAAPRVRRGIGPRLGGRHGVDCEGVWTQWLKPLRRERSPPVDLLVVGELCVDLIVGLTDDDIRFGQHEQLVPFTALTMGSSSAITACGAAAARRAHDDDRGRRRDEFGDFILRELARPWRSTCRDVRVDPSLPTGSSTHLTRPGGDRAILTAMGTIGQTTAADVPDSFDGAAHLHIGSWFLQHALWDDAAALFARARAAGLSTSVDGNFDPEERWDRGILNLIAHADVFFGNEHELAGITGISEPDAAVGIAAGPHARGRGRRAQARRRRSGRRLAGRRHDASACGPACPRSRAISWTPWEQGTASPQGSSPVGCPGCRSIAASPSASHAAPPRLAEPEESARSHLARSPRRSRDASSFARSERQSISTPAAAGTLLIDDFTVSITRPHVGFARADKSMPLGHIPADANSTR